MTVDLWTKNTNRQVTPVESRRYQKSGTVVCCSTKREKIVLKMAAENEKKNDSAQPKEAPKKKSCCHRKIYKATELPLYDAPKTGHQIQYEVVKAPKSAVESYISIGRKSIEQYAGPLEGAKDKVVHIYETGVAHTQSSYEYITADANMIPRVGAITVGGLTGLLVAARKGFFKKTLYGTTGALIAAAICYPKEAKQISNQAITKIQTDGFTAVKQQTGYDLNELFKWDVPKIPEVPDFSSILAKIGVQTPKPKSVEGDIGQSNPADKDMYTTRSK